MLTTEEISRKEREFKKRMKTRGKGRIEKKRVDDETSSGSDEVPPSPEGPSTSRRLNVALFSKRKRVSDSIKETKCQKKEETRRVRKYVKCSVCGTPQKNIWRHMISVHQIKQEPRHPQNIAKCRGYITYVCPVRIKGIGYKKCSKIVKRLGDHLRRTHQIRRGTDIYKKYMSQAEPIKREIPIKVEAINQEEIQCIVISDSDSEQVDKPKKDAPTQTTFKLQSSDTEVEADRFASTESDSEMEVDQYAPTQPQRDDHTRTPPDMFYNNKITRHFINYLQKTGIHRSDAVEYGAKAYYAWKRMDPNKTIGGLINSERFERFFRQTLTQREPAFVKSCLMAFVQLIQFLIKLKYVFGMDAIIAKEQINKVRLTLHWFSFNEECDKIEEKDNNVSDNQETDETNNTESDNEEVDTVLFGSTDYEEIDATNNKESDNEEINEMDNEESVNEWIHEIDSKSEDNESLESDESWGSEDLFCEESSTYNAPTEFTIETTNAATVSPIETPIETQFCVWLKNLPYLSTNKTAVQHMKQGMQIWKVLSPNFKIKGLLDKAGVNKYLNNFMEQMAPGTVNSYIGSYIRLMEFMMDISLFDKEDMDQARFMIDHVKTLRRTLKKRIKQQRTEKQTEEIQNMIKPEDIKRFLGSKSVSILERKAMQPGNQVVPSDFYDVRDYILFRLIQTNAQRPMAVRSITERVVQSAHRTDDGWATLAVADHKTSQSGPAMIALSPEMVHMMQNFLAMCKRIPNFPANQDRSIFVTYPKNNIVAEMTSSQINKSIQRIWKKGPVKKPISATKLRKSTATHVRAVVPDVRLKLAKHMSHDVRTADTFYDIYSQREAAKPIVQLIGTVMEGIRESNDDTDELEGSGMEGIKESNDGTDECKKDDTDKGSVEGQSITKSDKNNSDDSDDTLDYDYNDNDNELEYTNYPSPLNSLDIVIDEFEPTEKRENSQSQPKHGRRSFSNEESAKLISLCEDNLQKETLTKSAIKETLETTEEGRNLISQISSKLKGKDIWKMVTDRIHTERKKRRKLKEK